MPPRRLSLASRSLTGTIDHCAQRSVTEQTLFLVPGLIQHHLEIPRNLEVRDQAEATIDDRRGELDALLSEFLHRLLDVIAVKGDVVRP